MNGKVYVVVKTESGLKGYQNEWGYGPIPIQRLQQLHQHVVRMETTRYTELFKGREEEAERVFLAIDFEKGTEDKMYPLSENELKNPTGEYSDGADGILYIDATEFNFRYVFVDFKDYILWDASEYLLDYVLDLEEEDKDVSMLLHAVKDISVLDKADLKTSYPELFWEIENHERAKQMPDTRKRIAELKEEGLIEETIGYDYFKNTFYYRQALNAGCFGDGTIEKNALNELEDIKKDSYTLNRTRFLLDRDGTVWLQTENAKLVNFLVFLTQRIEDEYSALEFSLIID